MQDATWITASNSIKCTNADEVPLLLKSSDRVAHDICNTFDSCGGQPQQDVPYTLVLKKYYDLKPEREFRCFVQGHDLIGMSCFFVCSTLLVERYCCNLCPFCSGSCTDIHIMMHSIIALISC